MSTKAEMEIAFGPQMESKSISTGIFGNPF